MSFASLRRHALAPVIVAMVTLAPLGFTHTSTPAAAATTAPALATAAATTPVAAVKTVTHAKHKKHKKHLTKKQRHKLALKKAAHRKHPKPKAIAHALVERKYGWSHRQWTCLHRLWARESGWRVKADNPWSSAYGIPQALPGHKMGKGWRTSAKTQIRWGLRYIDGRYDTPCRANYTQLSRGWY